MSYKKLTFWISFLIFMSTLFFSTVSFAEDGADFTVSPIYGEGQTDSNLGYFSIKYEDKEEYPIKIKIKNLNATEHSNYTVRLISATTTNNGKIDYTPSDQKKAVKDAVSIEDFVSKEQVNQVIDLKPNEEKEVTFKLKKPVDKFNGTILGSVYVQKNIEKVEKQKAITNAFAMSIPIIISQDFEQKIIPKLELANIKVLLDMGKPTISGDISNTSPVMFGEIKIDSWITQRGKEEKLYEQQSENYEMAPNSTFSYAIDINNELLSPGDYTYHITLKSGKRVFDLSKNFNISSEEVQQKSSEIKEMTPKKDNTLLIIIFIILGIITALAIIYYVLVKQKIIEPIKINKTSKTKNNKG